MTGVYYSYFYAVLMMEMKSLLSLFKLFFQSIGVIYDSGFQSSEKLYFRSFENVVFD